MTIGYKNKFANGKPTYFLEKICAGVPPSEWKIPEWHADHITDLTKPKLHTIREDVPNRWEAGNIIHHCYYNRTPKRLCFLVNKCISTQRIQILSSLPVVGTNSKGKDVTIGSRPAVIIDGKMMDQDVVAKLAQNDGFDTTDEFFHWFNTDWVGKIIHWTKLKY